MWDLFVLVSCWQRQKHKDSSIIVVHPRCVIVCPPLSHVLGWFVWWFVVGTAASSIQAFVLPSWLPSRIERDARTSAALPLCWSVRTSRPEREQVRKAPRERRRRSQPEREREKHQNTSLLSSQRQPERTSNARIFTFRTRPTHRHTQTAWPF